MSSVTVITLQPPRYDRNGEQVSGAMQTSETERVNSVADVANKIDGLSIRHIYFSQIIPIPTVESYSALRLFGQDRDGAWVFVFVNGTQKGPSIEA